MVPSKIKIESFAKRYHKIMGTLGGKGLKQVEAGGRQFRQVHKMIDVFSIFA